MDHNLKFPAELRTSLTASWVKWFRVGLRWLHMFLVCLSNIIVVARHKLSPSGLVMLGWCVMLSETSLLSHMLQHLPEPVLLSTSYFLEYFL